jgi:hypothetical protein
MSIVTTIMGILEDKVLRSKTNPTLTKKNGTIKPKAMSLITLIISLLCRLLMPSNGFRSRINIQEKELSYLLTKRGVCGIFSGDISTDRGFKSL